LANFIPEETISEIRDRADIVEIVGDVVRLKKAGKNYLGLCPFHTEKTPSFSVSPDKQIFHCFGCGEGGNIFSFLIKYDGVSFPQAVRQVARRYGIDLPERPMNPAQQRRLRRREQMFVANKLAREFYHHCLTRSKAANAARRYLTDREISKDTVETFQLGFAPDGWRHLSDAFQRRGISVGLAEQVGLLIATRDGGGHYDRFRNRVIFPITDTGKRVIGFGGRVLDKSMPKYLNSPESPVFDKGRSFYGVPITMPHCRQSGRVFVVEGYFDLLALYTRGVKNVVATLGTALSERHIRLLKGFTEEIVLVFDADEAGVQAAVRSSHLFLDQGIEAKVLVLPDGHDPDSYLNLAGPEKFLAAADRAKGMLDFMINAIVHKHGLTIQGKMKIITEFSEIVSQLDDSVARSLYIGRIAEHTEIEPAAVAERVKAAADRQRRYSAHQTGPHGDTVQRRGKRDGLQPSQMSADSAHNIESQIVAMLVHHPKMVAEIKKRKVIERFENTLWRDIAAELVTAYDAGTTTVADIVQAVEDAEQQRLLASLTIQDNRWDECGCLRLLDQFDQVRQRLADPLLKAIARAEASGDQVQLTRLLQQRQAEVRQKRLR
jgi:DNA primase